MVIADGLTGKDYVEVAVNLKHFRTVKIASAACHADALLVVSHFRGTWLPVSAACGRMLVWGWAPAAANR